VSLVHLLGLTLLAEASEALGDILSSSLSEASNATSKHIKCAKNELCITDIHDEKYCMCST
jgi:hypothetical protein